MKGIFASIVFSGLLLTGAVNAAEEQEVRESWADKAMEMLVAVDNLAEVATTVTTEVLAEK